VHIGIAGSRSALQQLEPFLITFRRRTGSPYPESKPNMNENRNHSTMFGALRSPPPAANGNRSSSTAPCDLLIWLHDGMRSAVCEFMDV